MTILCFPAHMAAGGWPSVHEASLVPMITFAMCLVKDTGESEGVVSKECTIWPGKSCCKQCGCVKMLCFRTICASLGGVFSWTGLHFQHVVLFLYAAFPEASSRRPMISIRSPRASLGSVPSLFF